MDPKLTDEALLALGSNYRTAPTLADRQARVEAVRTRPQAAQAAVGLPFEAAATNQQEAAEMSAARSDEGARGRAAIGDVELRQQEARERGDRARAAAAAEIDAERQLLGNKPSSTMRDTLFQVLGGVMGATVEGPAGASLGAMFQGLGNKLPERIAQWQAEMQGHDRLRNAYEETTALENAGVESELSQTAALGKLYAADLQNGLEEIATRYKGQREGVLAEEAALKFRDIAIQQQAAARSAQASQGEAAIRRQFEAMPLGALELAAGPNSKVDPRFAGIARGVLADRQVQASKVQAADIAARKGEADISKTNAEAAEKARGERGLDISGLRVIPGQRPSASQASEAAKIVDAQKTLDSNLSTMQRLVDSASLTDDSAYDTAYGLAAGSLNAAANAGVMNEAEAARWAKRLPPSALSRRVNPSNWTRALLTDENKVFEDLRARFGQLAKDKLRTHNYEFEHGESPTPGLDTPGSDGKVEITTASGPMRVSPAVAEALRMTKK